MLWLRPRLLRRATPQAVLRFYARACASGCRRVALACAGRAWCAHALACAGRAWRACALACARRACGARSWAVGSCRRGGGRLGSYYGSVCSSGRTFFCNWWRRRLYGSASFCRRHSGEEAALGNQRRAGADGCQVAEGGWLHRQPDLRRPQGASAPRRVGGGRPTTGAHVQN